MSKVYLDNAATTPIRGEVVDAMIEVLRNNSIGNPSSIHEFGRQGRSLIEKSRISVANCLSAEPSEIIFTSSGTEANNLILYSAILNLKVKRIISSTLEHLSVIEPIKSLSEGLKIEIQWVRLKEKGAIDFQDLEEKLKGGPSPTLVSLMYANNEIGNLLDVKRVGDLCKKYQAYFHSDAIQVLGHFPLNMSKLPFDFVSASAHKFYGPTGIGFVFIRKSLRLEAMFKGGAQERGMRPGIENISGIVGLAKALEIASKSMLKDKKHIESLKLYCISELKKALPNISFNGYSHDLNKSIHTILSLKLPFKDELLSFRLDLKGIAVSTGSACSSGMQKTSHVIEAIYDLNQQNKNSFLRLSFGPLNQKEDIDRFILELCAIVSFEKNKKE